MVHPEAGIRRPLFPSSHHRFPSILRLYLEEHLGEIRLALRRLSKHAASTLVSVATLACAIGAAAVTWSALSAVLLNPVPVKDPSTLAVVAERGIEGREAGVTRAAFNYTTLPVIRDSGAFERTVAHWSPESLLVSTGGMPVRTNVGFATRDFFEVLGVDPPLGRHFTSEDDRRGAAPVALLTAAPRRRHASRRA